MKKKRYYRSSDSYRFPEDSLSCPKFRRSSKIAMSKSDQFLSHYRGIIAALVSNEDQRKGVDWRDYVKSHRIVRQLVPETDGQLLLIDAIKLKVVDGYRHIEQIGYALYEPTTAPCFPDFVSDELRELMEIEWQYLEITRQRYSGVYAKDHTLSLEVRNDRYVERRRLFHFTW